MRVRAAWVVVLLGLFAAGRASAVSYGATIQSPHPTGQIFQVGGIDPVSLSLSDTADLGVGSYAAGSASAAAGPGSLGGSSSALLVGGAGFNGGFTAVGQEYSVFSGYEVVISGPAGAITSFSINLDLEGSLSAAASGAGWLGGASVGVSGGVNTSFGGYPMFPDSGLSVTSNGAFSSSGAFSSLTSLPGGGILALPFTSSTFAARAGETINFQVVLSTLAYAYCSSDCPFGSATAAAGFAHTFGLASGGPVFNLDPGFTANSLDGCIADNLFVCATAPEPGASALAALGLAAACLARRRRGPRNPLTRRSASG